MGYQKADGSFAKTRAVDIVAGGVVPDGSTAVPLTRTTTLTGPWVELGDVGTLRLDLTVSAASGTTPTLDVALQTSKDAGVTDAAHAVASFTQKTAAAQTERKVFSGLDRYARAVYTIGGTTPSFTFTLTGEGVR